MGNGNIKCKDTIFFKKSIPVGGCCMVEIWLLLICFITIQIADAGFLSNRDESYLSALYPSKLCIYYEQVAVRVT